ncbi:AraC family transcriptional regulator [Streptomyces lydicus]|uniref:AraC family transcriptional regulator n=1 Tax=Streptomyces lydicus TaxID=47763 RepID=A0A1D7VXF9_9ACTN|nr:AraC family transcriptional regulator [Streptomyces lydicus]
MFVSLLPNDTAGHDAAVTQRRVVFLVYPRFQVLDLAGPHEVFAQTERWVPEGEGYDIEIVAGRAGAVRSCHGIDVTAGSGAQQCQGPLDTLVVVGGPGDREAVDDEELVGWIKAAAGRARRVASVCTGAFLLARAGLLDGRRAVTHWAACERLAHEHPAVTVTPDQIFVHDGEVWTSAGITAGMDLALAMVEEDHGPEVSRAVARMLVMFVQRPGGQAQFSTQLAAQAPTRKPLRDVQAWVTDHLADDLTVPVLAERAGMSERNFTRVFRAETGLTPAAYVETVRVEAARALLETTDTTIDAIARACGFGFAETLHRRFKHTLGVTPGQYRHHFSRAG